MIVTNKKIVLTLIKLPSIIKKLILILSDITLLILSFAFAFIIRLGDFNYLLKPNFIYLTCSIVFINIFLLYFFNFYQAISRYINLNIIKSLFASSVISVVIIYYISSTFYFELPRSVPIIYIILSLILLSSSRFIIRIYLNTETIVRKKSVIIYGAGQAGRQLNLNLEIDKNYKVFGFLDDSRKLQGRQIDGKTIFSPQDLSRLVEKYSINLILLAIPTASSNERKKVLNYLEKYKVKIKSIPNVDDIVSGKFRIDKFQDIEVRDFLTREVVKPNHNLLKLNIDGNTVMITGAGGSIGSELTRQIYNLNPKRIILLELSEFALYSIQTELEDKAELSGDRIEIIPLLASVKDVSRLEQVFNKYDIDTIYHAAAYKHVPIIENNVIEGIKNNVFGTENLAKLASKYNVDSFILISTDKAVNASSIMGASKRLSELICQNENNNSKTHFSIVRFGNVLGSSGSVIPRFQEQIKNGGPVKVTSPNMTRYVMTIQEAAELVIQAGALSEDGNILILDMGEPIKILDLAKKMIHLTGQSSFINGESPNTDGDIEIRFTGLRPGEKLHEELQFNNEVEKTIHPRIMKAIEPRVEHVQLQSTLDALLNYCEENNVKNIIEILFNSQSGYKSDKTISDLTL